MESLHWKEPPKDMSSWTWQSRLVWAGSGGLSAPVYGAQATEQASQNVELSLKYPLVSGPAKALSISWNELKWLRRSKINWTDFRFFILQKSFVRHSC